MGGTFVQNVFPPMSKLVKAPNNTYRFHTRCSEKVIVTSILYNWKSHGCTIYHVTSDALWYIKSDIRFRLLIKNAGKSTLRFVIQSVSEKRDIFRNFKFSIAVLSDFASLTVSSFDIVSIVQFILVNIHRSRGRNFVWVATAESELFTVIFNLKKNKFLD